MPWKVLESEAQKRRAAKEKKQKLEAVLSKTPTLSRYFGGESSSHQDQADVTDEDTRVTQRESVADNCTRNTLPIDQDTD